MRRRGLRRLVLEEEEEEEEGCFQGEVEGRMSILRVGRSGL